MKPEGIKKNSEILDELFISEARYKGIVEDQNELIVRFTNDKIVTFANSAYCKYFGKTKEELIGFSFEPQIPEEDKEKLEMATKMITMSNPFVGVEYRVLNGEGEIKWVHYVKRGIFNQKGELIEYQGVGRDITLKKEYEEKTRVYLEKLEERTKELEKSKIELEVNNRQYMSMIQELKKKEEQLIRSEKLAIIGEFAGGITHEIKNPLGAIITNVQLMKGDIEAIKKEYDSEFVEEIESSAEIIEIAAKQAKDIITSLLAYTKIEEVKYKQVDLNNVINTSALLLKKELIGIGINLINECTEGLYIKGKSGELTQVLLNLILNSKDALLEKNGTSKYIKIRVYEENNKIILSVEDNGIGMSEEEKKKIFEPFYTTKSHGTGLGMSISQTILNKHKADINIESKKNEWTRFNISFNKYEEDN